VAIELGSFTLDAGAALRGVDSMTLPNETNVVDLEADLLWFRRVLEHRIEHYFAAEPRLYDVSLPDAPDLSTANSPYAAFVSKLDLTSAERLALVLALVPHLRPHLLDAFSTRNSATDRPFTEFGCLAPRAGGYLVPTGETLVFLLGGLDLGTRFLAERMFTSAHVFSQQNILSLAPMTPEDISSLKSPLRISDTALAACTTGEMKRPLFGASFPAQRIETQMSWDDLVLHPGTRAQLDEIVTWCEHGRTLMNDWGMISKLRPGYRSLFFGPPGTGKTMTACLLGKSTKRDVYKVDISLVVSKYIGETEKNLNRVFDQAEHKHWILFFDEADALFGKRGETRDAHDRYANQEVAFLLQRIESFDGIAILASNLKDNLDPAFARRFESVIYFPLPRPEERLLLWKQGFSAKASFEPAVDLEKIARDHALSGGAIMNVIRYVSLQALKEGGRSISLEDLMHGVRREQVKEGKTQ
jgi:ATPase family associated with various cellular activities (AAA)